MNVFGKRERSWRKTRKRGVSPIIATILLVAITVVLAAVLYVLISGLTHGVGSTPLGTNFSWGYPINATGSSPLPTQCTAGTYCYTIEIAGSSVTTSNVVFSLRNNVGSTISWPTAAGDWTIYLISPTVSTTQSTYTVSTSTWAPAAGFTGTIGAGYSLVLASTLTPTTGHGLFGDQLVAVGGSGYSGTVPSNSFS